MMKVVLVGVLLFITLACGGFVETVYTATLSNGQVVPPPRDAPPTRGTAVCIFSRNRDPLTIDCEVEHNVIDVTTAHIRVGGRGENGPVIYTFSSNLATNFRQSFTLVDLTGYSPQQQVQDFLSGNWYINIESLEYPTGEIRGQLEQTDRFFARLSATNTIPRASGTSARGIALGSYDFPTRELALDLVHSVQNPQENGLQLHVGAPGKIGPLAFAFNRALSPVSESVRLSINEEAEFLEDLMYLNLASVNNPTGEIRGQVITIDYIDELAFTLRMNSQFVVPPTESDNRGGGLFTYHCDSKVLEYLIMHDIPDATGSFIGAGVASVQGVPLFTLSNSQSPIFGSIQLTVQEELFLYARQMYVTIGSTAFPQGEIRGQVTVDFDWWAYLSGTNVVSPVTTPAVGVATMRLFGDQNRRVDYSIFHNVVSPQRASINVARAGDNGPSNFGFRTVFSPIRGNDIVLDDDDLQAFVTEASYITITSTAEPFLGEIRGQIRRVNPCAPKNDNSLTVSVSDQVNQNIPPSASLSARTFNTLYTFSAYNFSQSNGDTFSVGSPNNDITSNNSPNVGSPGVGGGDDNSAGLLQGSLLLVFALFFALF